MIMFLLKIFLPSLIQGGYDYLGWKVIFKEQSGHRFEWIYRTIKFLLDFPVTILVFYLLDYSLKEMITFYILKQAGFCDGVYIVIWKLLHPYSDYTQDGIYWLWWSFPLGLIRNRILYNIDLRAYEPSHVFRLFGRWWLVKGILQLKEFNFQLVIGLIISFIIFII